MSNELASGLPRGRSPVLAASGHSTRLRRVWACKVDPALILAAALCCAASGAMACGKERWPVKVVADRDAAQIVANPVDATIAQLGALPAPPHPEQHRDTRWLGETTIYRITATLRVIKREADGDLHLVLADDAGHTMIAESPDPACANGSRFGVEIKEVRDALEARYGSVRRARPNVRVTVTGVLFFDPCHGQEGRAPNCVELHPLLSIEFGK